MHSYSMECQAICIWLSTGDGVDGWVEWAWSPQSRLVKYSKLSPVSGIRSKLKRQVMALCYLPVLPQVLSSTLTPPPPTPHTHRVRLRKTVFTAVDKSHGTKEANPCLSRRPGPCCWAH